MLVNTKESTLLAGGWDNRLRINKSFGPLNTVWEPQALHLRHTPFIQVKQDYWKVCNLGTKRWFRPIKLQVTESSQWRTAVRHYSVKSTQFEKPNAPHDPNQCGSNTNWLLKPLVLWYTFIPHCYFWAHPVCSVCCDHLEHAMTLLGSWG